ncbi:MAG: ImmA/IrrE family metallo-endopeptidase [Candidatus Acidiferrales bacterium]
MRPNRSGFYRRRDGEERIWFSAAEIEMMMEDALRNSGVFPSEAQPAVDIERLIQELGVWMDQHAVLDAIVLGLTEFCLDGPPRIFINRDLTGAAMDEDETSPGIRGRWRATVAHEGVHVLLHRVLFEVNRGQENLFQVENQAAPQRLLRCLKKNVLFRGAATADWREVQANMGMAALLMPQSLFRRLADKVAEERGLKADAFGVGSGAAAMLTAELARLFEVSKQAAGIRLQTLGILSPVGQPWLIHEVQ